MSDNLFTTLTLPNGQVLPNRIAKAAMEEHLSGTAQLPDSRLITLYRTWSQGGSGLLITGNVMVHDAAMTGPGGVVLDKDSPIEPFREWAAAAQHGGSKVWMQINHPGRQVKANMPGVAWGPSAGRVNTGRTSSMFAEAQEMTEQQIQETIQRFVDTALRAKEAGFDGVEVHAAHGYLLSQFLSPLVNKRNDQWGGSLDNRARMLLEIVKRIRAQVEPEFAVSVKLNSADFQRGGFDADDAARVIAMLASLGVDLVELSGGSYESPAMTGNPQDSGSSKLPGARQRDSQQDSRTAAREAYFLELAEQLVADSSIPLMVTGGITHRATAEAVVDSGVAVVGIGTALAVDPDLPNKWQTSGDARVTLSPIKIKDKAIASAASMARVRFQLHRMGRGQSTMPKFPALLAFAWDLVIDAKDRREYTKWLNARR